MRRINLIIIPAFFLLPVLQAQEDKINSSINKLVENQLQLSGELYKYLHTNPELSLMEKNTSERLAREIRELGFEVTTGVGGYGVVGLFRNGNGPALMLRTDMDALPVKEATGLDWASKVIMKDAHGVESPAMHACGHDLHMTVWLGTLKTMVSLKKEWKGTLMAIAQPAEEGFGGAALMIEAGLFTKFPSPDAAFCYHVSSDLPVGTIGYFPGPIFAGVNSVDMTVFGIGGHGAMPHNTIDPIVLSARIILDLQTIVSREINPFQPAVVTVGSIHGGTKHNIIPDEVKMQMTIRFFDDSVYKQIQEALVRISRGIAISAGLPENKMPVVKLQEDYIPPVNNDPDLVMKSVSYIASVIGKENIKKVDPATVAEDFARYGRTEAKIPIALFWLGGINKDKYEDHIKKGTSLPSLHNSSFLPDFVPAYKCGVSCMSRILIDNFNKK